MRSEIIDRVYKWAAENAAKYEMKYMECGSPSALKTKEHYEDICDVCRLAEIASADEDVQKRRRLNNQYAVLARLDDTRKVAPGKTFSYEEVRKWMQEMMV